MTGTENKLPVCRPRASRRGAEGLYFLLKTVPTNSKVFLPRFMINQEM